MFMKFIIYFNHLNKEVSNKSLKNNLINLVKILIPFTPHMAYECLEMLGAKDTKIWPKVDKINSKEKIKWQYKLMAKQEMS